MDNHMSEMGDVYEQMLKEAAPQKGESFEGAKVKGKPPTQNVVAGLTKTTNSNVSNSPDTVEKGKGKKMNPTIKGITDSAQTPKLALSFDDLYNKVINEADEDVVPTPDVEGDDFSETTGDFDTGEGTDVDEEIDLASELRLLADRLSELADKLSVEDPDAALGDELGGEEGGEEMGEEPSDIPPTLSRESVTEAIVSEPTPKPMKKTTLGPKMKQNPSNKMGKSGAGKASLPAQGKDRSGKPSPAPKTTLGPKMSQNPSGTGPAVKGGQATVVA
jgi:hypothetical protein